MQKEVILWLFILAYFALAIAIALFVNKVDIIEDFRIDGILSKLIFGVIYFLIATPLFNLAYVWVLKKLS